MTIYDLVKVFKLACYTYNEAHPGCSPDDLERAGIAAVVRALRDEIVPQYWKLTDLSTVSAHDLRRFFNEILGSDADAAAGGPTREDGLDDTATAEPAADPFDFEAHLARQAAWSEKTFGPGRRTAGVCDHIRKELAEVERDPEDSAEWIDVVILALDGAWRSGLSPRQIIDGVVTKQSKNEGRTWPDWRTADPNKAIEHDRSKDTPAADHSYGIEPRSSRLAADAVCVWIPHHRTEVGIKWEAQCGAVSFRDFVNCPSCGKPIIFKEPSHD